jgi:hypothetical protein
VKGDLKAGRKYNLSRKRPYGRVVGRPARDDQQAMPSRPIQHAEIRHVFVTVNDACNTMVICEIQNGCRVYAPQQSCARCQGREENMMVHNENDSVAGPSHLLQLARSLLKLEFSDLTEGVTYRRQYDTVIAVQHNKADG